MIYQIVEAATQANLVVQVNLLLKTGWYCQGGVTVTVSGLNSFLCQAMIKPK